MRDMTPYTLVQSRFHHAERYRTLIRWLVGLVGLALMAPMAVVPACAQFNRGDLQPIVTVGRVAGNGDNEEVDIGELRLGRGHYFRDRLGLCGELSLYRPTGRRDGRSVDTIGLGLAFALRWHFLRQLGFSLYTDWGFGLMVGLNAFPPEGTHYNGTPYFGLGLSARLRQDIQLLAGLRQLHISNGKGVVPENPSFDGLGAYLGVALRPGFKAPLPPERESLPFGGGGLQVRAEATFDNFDEENSPGGLLALDMRLLPAAKIHTQIAFSAAELAGEAIWEVALHVYRQTPAGRVALGYSRQGFSVFRSDYYDLQIGRALNDISIVEFIVSLEHKNLDDDRVFGGLFIAVYPTDVLALRSGIGFERQEYEFFESLENLNDAVFNFGVEWSPGPLADFGLSFYFDGGIGYGVKTAGLRFQPGRQRSLGERRRGGGLVLLR